MMTNPLFPGHTQQAFSLFRAGLYAGVVPIKEKNPLLGKSVQVLTYLLSKGTEYLEVPIRTIEDVALTAINLAGALFSTTCQKNLPNCVVFLAADVLDLGTTALVLYFPLLRTITIAYHILCALNEMSADPSVISNNMLMPFDRIKLQRENPAFS